ncbi:MAG: response regulator [Bacteroidetes bacterium]|jgi:DNA-binding NarL/FixJ family response regulator|nr:response regulator [Bacteroidota bacterium]
MNNTEEIGIAIIEDDPLLAEQMVRLLSAPQHQVRVHYMAYTVEELVDAYLQEAEELNVILLDLDLKGQMSLPHIPELKRLAHPVKVLVVTGYEDEDMLTRAIELGADGYFVKSANPRLSLPEVVRLTYKGGAYLEPHLSAKVLEALQRSKRAVEPIDFYHLAQQLGTSFSKREIQVLSGLIDELSYQEVADLHFISINTVRHYVKLLYQKLDVGSKKELIQRVRALHAR